MLFLNKIADITNKFDCKTIISQQLTMFQTTQLKKLWIEAVTKQGADGIANGIWSKAKGNAYIQNYTKSLPLILLSNQYFKTPISL